MAIDLTPVVLAVLTGFCLGGGWWLYVDGVIDYHNHPHLNITSTHPPQNTTIPYNGAWVTPGIVTTVSMIAMNCISIVKVRDTWEGRLWLLITATGGLLGLYGAIWIVTQDFNGNEWPGLSIVLQCVTIMLGGVIYFLRLGMGNEVLDL